MKKSPIILFIIVLWLASLACGQTVTVPTIDPNAAQTAIVETLVAMDGQAPPSGFDATNPAAELATVTSLPSLTPPPTGTSAIQMITVSVDTFCRVGPGKDYEKVGILLVGETTEIVGRHATGQYWYVRNPDVGVDNCWISGEFATITGNTLTLLVHTPPALQATDFEIVYRGQGHCASSYWSDIRLKNLSGSWFKSISMVVRDVDTNTVRTVTGNGFSFRDGCSPPTSVEILIQGSTVMISTPEFGYNLNAHNMSVSITLCTEQNLTGGCLTKGIAYIP